MYYKNIFLTYNQDAVCESLNESDKMVNRASFNQFKSIDSSISSNFSSADVL